MNTSVKNKIDQGNIFEVNDSNFQEFAIEVFNFQFDQNAVYRQYCNTLKVTAREINTIEQIPYLPIQFFKTHQVTTTKFEPSIVFESSGTTQKINSRHLVKSLDIYKTSFTKAFSLFYGNPEDWCVLALLPSYLERSNSSLVMMAENLIQLSKHNSSGFYLNNLENLKDNLMDLELKQQKTLLIGVTFALLDFAELYPMSLKHSTIIETGGMKGRRAEITRQAVHEKLRASFELEKINSEYGMTELMSQAYSKGDGIFKCPPWMKIMHREEDDPLAVSAPAEDNILKGAVNVIDLANIYSCSFIATEDAGKLYSDGSFEILGRLDHTDTRGCSLLAL